MSKQKAGPRVPDTYFDLVRRFPLVPIRGEDHLDEATTVLHDLIARTLDEGESAYLDVLTDLVEAYEAEHDPPAHVPPADLLKELLYQNRLTQGELAKQTGIAQSTISAIIKGARNPTVEHARKLGERFKLEPTVFLLLSDHAEG